MESMRKGKLKEAGMGEQSALEIRTLEGLLEVDQCDGLPSKVSFKRLESSNFVFCI